MHHRTIVSCPEIIRLLAIELSELETHLGRPDSPPDLEDRVVELAHRLRNELQLHELHKHSEVHRRLAALPVD